MARAQLSVTLESRIVGVPLITFKKRNDKGVRPIAAGETLHRLVRSVLTQRAHHIFSVLLKSNQHQVTVSIEAEACIKTVSKDMRAISMYASTELLQKNPANTFSLAGQQISLKVTKEYLHVI